MQEFPDIQLRYKQRIVDLYAQNNPHVLYGSIFVGYINDTWENSANMPSGKIKQVLKKCFLFLEGILSSADFETRCLGETSVLEALLGEEGGLERYAPFMGPETKVIAKDIACKWGLDIRLLS